MKTRLRSHFFAWDPSIPEDMKGRRFCLCELREDHPVHNVPKRSEDERRAEARKVGERA